MPKKLHEPTFLETEGITSYQDSDGAVHIYNYGDGTFEIEAHPSRIENDSKYLISRAVSIWRKRIINNTPTDELEADTLTYKCDVGDIIEEIRCFNQAMLSLSRARLMAVVGNLSAAILAIKDMDDNLYMAGKNRQDLSVTDEEIDLILSGQYTASHVS